MSRPQILWISIGCVLFAIVFVAVEISGNMPVLPLWCNGLIGLAAFWAAVWFHRSGMESSTPPVSFSRALLRELLANSYALLGGLMTVGLVIYVKKQTDPEFRPPKGPVWWAAVFYWLFMSVSAAIAKSGWNPVGMFGRGRDNPG